MEKTTLGLVAALGALVATPAAANVDPATTEKILNPTSIAELLNPVANPVETMKALRAEDGKSLAPVEVADEDVTIGIPGIGFRRHHHHHHHYRVYRHHHHHHYHHHHHNY